MTRKIYLMRHGQTLFNLQERIQGWSDSPLTPEGIEQAKQAGRFLKEHGYRFDSLYCSTSERASDTLELVTGRTDYQRIKGLKEMHFGRFEGMPEDLHPEASRRGGHGDYYAQHGGESQKEASERVFQAVSAIVKEDPAENILMVSHAGAIIQFFVRFHPFNKLPSIPRNCCLFEYEVQGDSFKCLKMIDPIAGKEYLIEDL